MQRHALLALLAGLCLTRLAEPAEPENLLVNPSFEQGTGDQVEGWTRIGKATHLLDPKHARSGRGAVRVRFSDRYAQRLPAQPGHQYVLTGHVRRIDPKGNDIPKVKIYFLGATAKSAGVVANEFRKVSTTYTPFRYTFVPPPGTAVINLTLCGEFNGSGWFLYDDMGLTAVKSRDMPSWADTPSLHGKTVTVADIADCRSFALMRVPPRSLLPIDGQLGTHCTTRRADYVKRPPSTCNFDLSIEGETAVNHMVVHCSSPEEVIRSATVVSGRNSSQALARVECNESRVFALDLRPTRTSWVRVAVHTTPDKPAHVSEIQFFGIADRGDGSAKPTSWSLAPSAAPKDYAPHMQAAIPGLAKQPVLLAGPQPANASVTLPADSIASMLGPPAESQHGVSALSLRLDLETATAQNALEISLKRCRLFDGNLNYMVWSDRQVLDGMKNAQRYNYANRFVAYTRLARGRNTLDVRFVVPTMVFEPGERLWVCLRPSDAATLHLGQSRLAAETMSAGEADRAAFARILRVARWLYSIETEAHAYDSLPYQDMFIHRYVQRALSIEPQNEIAGHILRRVARRRIDVGLPRPGPAAAPDWAVWARAALKNYNDILMWWIDTQQIENGELGGHFNDDTEFSCRWSPFYLMTHDPKLQTAIRKIADGCSEYMGEAGYSNTMMDVEHAAEDAMCSQPQMLTVEYGNPEYVERLMLWSSYLPMWTGINKNGDRLFRSYMFNARHINAKPKYDIDHVYDAQAMAGPYTLAWYSDSEIPRKWFLEWIRSWAKATMSTEGGKPAGGIPCDIHFATGKIAPYTGDWRKSVYYSFGRYTMRNAFVAGYALSRDSLLLEPFHSEPNVRGGSAGVAWRLMSGDTRHDEFFVSMADRLVESYARPVLEPQPGPEVKVAAPASRAAELAAPMRRIQDPQASDGSYLTTPAGTATYSGRASFTLDIPKAGRYAACALIRGKDGRSDSFWVSIDEHRPAAIATGPVHGKWVWATAPAPADLAAGTHTVTVQCREAEAQVSSVGLTTKFTLDRTWSSNLGVEAIPYLAWRITGDKRYLVEQLKETNREFERWRWLLTEGEPATDRVPVPGSELLPCVYLGGCAGGMKATFPYLAISWEGGGTDYAALVLENSPKHLKALVYSFAAQPTRMTARVWELEHGEYDVTFGSDEDRDDKIDRASEPKRMTLKRFDPIALDLAFNLQYVLDVRQVKKLDPILSRADLAISRRDVTVAEDGRRIAVLVHNIGVADARDFVVAVRDSAGRELGRTRVAALKGVSDAKPSTQRVVVALPRSSKRVEIAVDPANAVPEITEVNNACDVAP